MAESRGANARKAIRRTQPISFGGKIFRGAIYDRAKLDPGTSLSGPALVIDFGSTTVLPPGFKLRVDGYRNLILRRG
jgi:N-methylhydantoinase A